MKVQFTSMHVRGERVLPQVAVGGKLRRCSSLDGGGDGEDVMFVV